MKAVALLSCLAAALAPVVEAGSIYHFDGPRQPVVTIENDALPWKGRVVFLGVKCFGASLNNSINQGKAKGYLFMALAKMMNATDVSVSGLQILKCKSGADGRFFADFLIPEKPVLAQQSAQNAISTQGNRPQTSFVSTTNLLSRKSDWIQTLDATKTALASVYPSRPSNQPNDLDRFCSEIASTEETIRQSFGSLDAQIQRDRLLLSNEKKELCEHDAKNLQACLDSLKIYAGTSIPSN